MSDIPYPMEVDVVTAAAEIENGATVLDVREPAELVVCQIQGSLNIPMGQIPLSLHILPRDKYLLVMCHHGMRSGQVTAFLRNKGFDCVVNVAGGIEAWAQQVDPQMSRY